MNKRGSMDIRVYTLEELESHIQTAFPDPKEVTPLSPLRLHSYLKNPRAEKDDPVLFELWDNKRLIAYRTLLPDFFYDSHDFSHRFAWLSGNWVDPEFRRKGLSTRLLQELETAWDGKLMYTNYAPASKAVYDQTKQFPLLAKRPGKRFYLRAAAEDLLAERLGARDLLRLGDKAVNQLREQKLLKFKAVDNAACFVEKISALDPQLEELAERLQQTSLFRRTPGLFGWILRNPWLTMDQGLPLNYHFSYQVKKFENKLFKFSLPNRQIGLLWIIIHKRTLSVPYVFAESDLLYPHMARTMIHQMIGEDCAHTTVRNSRLVAALMAFRNSFLTIRSMPQHLFVHQSIANLVDKNKEIHDGDGDVVFTG